MIQHPRRWGALLLSLLFVASVHAMDGKLYALDEATVLKFTIQRSLGAGSMTAENPATGEKFDGTYTAIKKGQSAFAKEPKTPGGAFLQGYNGAYVPPYATARGVLIGDKGTMIELYMEIQPGLRPRGHGEGTDNKKRRYQVQF